MLIVSRKSGESLVISDNIRITILNIGSDKVAVGIDAPREIKVVRQELIETIEANQASAITVRPDDYKGIAQLIKNNKKME